MKKALMAATVVGLIACSEATSPVKSVEVPGSISSSVGTGIVTVTETDVTRQAENTLPTDNWVLYTRPSADVESGDFVLGPGTPLLGVGSFRTVTATNGSKVFLFNYDHIGVALADITGISYNTWKAPGVTTSAFPSLNIQIDINGGSFVAGDFRTLVFEPYIQPGFADATGVWQARDAFNSGNAKWWSTGATVCTQGTPCTWTTFLANYPDATILGGFGINQGSGNSGTDGASDALSIAYGGNSVTYDFEPARESCMKGGWESLTRADGTSFNNQGDCISYVTTGV